MTVPGPSPGTGARPVEEPGPGPWRPSRGRPPGRGVTGRGSGGGDHREQQVRLLTGARVQRDVAAEHVRRTVAGVVVLEGPDAVPHPAELLPALVDVARVHVVPAADGERNAVTG